MSVVTCWESGPPVGDYDTGCGSVCMLEQGHEGDHEFTPDTEVTISFGQQVPADSNETD